MNSYEDPEMSFACDQQREMDRLESAADGLIAEVARLRALNAELVGALESVIQSAVDLDEYIWTRIADNQQRRADSAIEAARAAIAKARGE